LAASIVSIAWQSCVHDNRECLGGNGCFTLGLLEFAVFKGGGDVGGVVVEDDILQVREVPGVKTVPRDRNDIFFCDCGEREDLLPLNKGKKAHQGHPLRTVA
jgi:hypothetical protein